MNVNSLQDIINAASTGGWDFVEGVNPEAKKALTIQQAKDAEDQKSIARAWARFARSSDGKKALEQLFDTTLRRTVFFTSLGLDPMSMAVFGAFREGQNALAHEIARQIGLGNSEATKPRDI
ncbi:hypothetical protein [Agrobacterium sp. 22117]|uniref:hypothetical protein n=1 Tax=Agrobacterium sp. 22117 TaxID=3453880 RepID=UPI003F82576D